MEQQSSPNKQQEAKQRSASTAAAAPEMQSDALALSVGTSWIGVRRTFGPPRAGGLVSHAPATPAVAQRALASIVQRASGHARGCTCPACSGVQRRTDSGALQRAPDPAAHGSRCGCSSCTQDRVQRSAQIAGFVQRHHHHEEEEAVQRSTQRGGFVQRHPGHEEEEAVQRSMQHGGPSAGQSAAPHGGACGCGMCRIVQRAADGFEAHAVATAAGGELDGRLGARVQALHGGEPLPPVVRREMEEGFGADFGSVRVHTGDEADALNRDMNALAFTHGAHIAFARGQYDPATRHGKRLLAHELTHTLQQGAVQAKPQGVQRMARSRSTVLAAARRRAAESPVRLLLPGAPTIQRHSSFEHKMLGDVTPDDLELIASTEDIENDGTVSQMTPQQPGAAVQQVGGQPFQAPNAAPGADNRNQLQFRSGGHQGQTVRKENVLHVLKQEIDRIKFWRDHPPQANETRQQYTVRLQQLEAQRRQDVESEKQGLILKRLGQGGLSNTEQSLLDQDRTQTNLDPQWQVRLVAIPYDPDPNVPPMLCTYGELNTLADFYGSSKELRNADPTNRQQMLNGIRQQSLFKFMDLYDKVAGGSHFASALNPTRVGEGFKNAIGTTGRGAAFGPLTAGPWGEVRLMGTFDTGTWLTPKSLQGKRADKAEEGYSAGLARNACHFAPESWHAWAKYHGKARVLARQAYGERVRMEDAATRLRLINAPLAQRNQIPNPRGLAVPANDPFDLHKASYQREYDRSKQRYERISNDAIIENGFGDHYLQDSFAAGHLINKTEIMRWMVKWLDEDAMRIDWTKDKNWRRIQAVAYGQEGLGLEDRRYDPRNVGTIDPKDPQSVENIDGNDWTQRFDALGLRLPPSLNPQSIPTFPFLIWWQDRAMKWNRTRTMTVELAVKEGWARRNAEIALSNLVQDHVARIDGEGINPNQLHGQDRSKLKYILRDDYVPKSGHKDQFHQDVQQYRQGQNQAQFEAMHERRSKAATYKGFHEFLNNTLLQASTNVLHDHYCKNGVRVVAGNGTHLGRVYGDDAMLGKGSSFGVRYSAQTANMSRDVIYEIIEQGTENTAPAATNISERFPASVDLSDHGGGQPKLLANWHKTDLKQLCTTQIFDETIKSAKGVIGGVKGNDLAGQVSKDATKQVHEGDSF